MLSFRERLSDIATYKQEPKKLPPYAMHKIDLKNKAVNLMEEYLLDYFSTLSRNEIIQGRKMQFKIVHLVVSCQLTIKDIESKYGFSEEFDEVWEAEFVYDFIKKAFESEGFSIEEEKTNNNIEKYFVVTIKP